jgi:phosphate transport system permease protein
MIPKNLSDYIARNYRKRKLWNYLMCGLLGAATIMALVPLLSVFSYVLTRGLPAIDLGFFTQLPKPVGETGGGMANAFAGTGILVALAALFGIPVGIAVGMYLSEYGSGRFGSIIRFVTDMMASIPSIIIGLFVYTLVVIPMKRFSAIAGGISLAILMIPIIARSTEELLKMVPTHIREAGLALGLPRWKVTLRIVLRGSLGGITTGIMLSVARVAGETAPLLFTAFGNRMWHSGLDQPIASLPVQIYTYAISPYEDWHRQAWAGALVLVCLVFMINIVTRLVLRPAPLGRD